MVAPEIEPKYRRVRNMEVKVADLGFKSFFDISFLPVS